MYSSLQNSSSNASASSMSSDGDPDRPPGTHMQTNRAFHPGTSVEAYSRIMLEYTQRRMAGFTDSGDGKGYDSGFSSSRSSRSSSSQSGQSGASASGLRARQAANYSPSRMRQHTADGANGHPVADYPEQDKYVV